MDSRDFHIRELQWSNEGSSPKVSTLSPAPVHLYHYSHDPGDHDSDSDTEHSVSAASVSLPRNRAKGNSYELASL